jgi:alanine racemase
MSKSTAQTRHPGMTVSRSAEKYSEKSAYHAERIRRSWVEIDLAALVRNTRRTAALLPPTGQLIPSVKKLAYGHGIVEVINALTGLDRIGPVGIATMDEALALRDAGIQQPLICFGPTPPGCLEDTVRLNKVTHTIVGAEDAGRLDAAAERAGTLVEMHLKIDTGMGRLGKSGDELLRELHEVCSLSSVRLTGLWTHLAAPIEKPGSGHDQVNSLMSFRKKADLEDIPIHLGGTDALGLLDHLPPDTSIRSGIALYGDHSLIENLEPVMTFKSRIIQVRRVPAGTSVSYGRTFTTQRPSVLALAGAGYGNGCLRSLSGVGQVLIHGRCCPLAGRICMDQCVVDVTDCPSVCIDDEVVFFGRQNEALLPVGKVAESAGTISYELMCLAGHLNPRIYLES